MNCPLCGCPRGHEHHHHHQPTVEELIAQRDWKALDSMVGDFGHETQTLVLYKMLKVLLDNTPKH